MEELFPRALRGVGAAETLFLEALAEAPERRDVPLRLGGFPYFADDGFVDP